MAVKKILDNWMLFDILDRAYKVSWPIEAGPLVILARYECDEGVKNVAILVDRFEKRVIAVTSGEEFKGLYYCPNCGKPWAHALPYLYLGEVAKPKDPDIIAEWLDNDWGDLDTEEAWIWLSEDEAKELGLCDKEGDQ